MPTVKHTFCRICEPLCPLLAEMGEGGEIKKLSPDRAHPITAGFACRKGLSYLDVHRDPDRLDHPCTADGASVYMSTGVNQSRQGTLAYWLLNMLSFVTGNLGRAAITMPRAFPGWRRPADPRRCRISIRRSAACGIVLQRCPRASWHRALVFNRPGSVTTPVTLDDTLLPGVVAMSHGYGHDGAHGISRANAAPDVNVNRLLPTGPGSYEKLSNMSHMNGVPVQVSGVPVQVRKIA